MSNVSFVEVIKNVMYGMIAHYLDICFIVEWVSHHKSNMTNNIKEKVRVLPCNIVRADLMYNIAFSKQRHAYINAIVYYEFMP